MSETIDQRVERECVRALYRQGPLASVIALVVGSIILAAMWRSVPHAWLWAWFALVAANQATRIAMGRAFHRENPDGARVKTWARRYAWGMAIGGMLFGSTAVFMFPLASPLGQAFVTIMVSGMAAGSVPPNAYHRPAMLAYLLAILMPMVAVLAYLAFAHDAREYGLLAFAYVFYVLVLLGFGNSQAELLRKTVEFSHRNDDLVEELQLKTEIAEAAKRKAEQASLAKSQFFAAASHDLRQPLQALGLYAASLREAKREPEDARKIDQILSSVDALESLFDELLDISKLDAGYVEPHRSHFAARKIFERLEANFSPLARKNGLTLEFEGGGNVLYSDPVLLDRVLANLVSNALRYSETGGAAVRCTVLEGTAAILVEDMGIGIPLAQQERVFDEFYQLGNPERDRRKGLGLGLATVRRITQLLGHPMAMTSAEGQGTTFRIQVPAGDASQVAADATTLKGVEVDALVGRSVLVIEDETMVRDGMVQLLKDWRCRVTAAASAADALALLREPPDAIVADYRLRENQNGIAVIATVRERFGGSLPAILITGDTAPEIFAAARDNRLPLLTKPVRAARLRAALQHLLSERREPARTAA